VKIQNSKFKIQNSKFGILIILVGLLLSLSSLTQAQVKEYEAPRFFGKPMKAYVDSVTAHRIFIIDADSLVDQTLLKFKLEEDIEIERVSFFAQDTTTGDTTALYFYEGTLLVDSLIIPVQSSYLEFATNFTLTKDSSFVAVTVNDGAWSAAAAGAPKAKFTVQYRVARE